MNTADQTQKIASRFEHYKVVFGLTLLSILCFAISLLFAPTNLVVIADVCRHATFALLAGAITALIYEWRGAHDATLVAQNTATQIIAEITNIHRNYIPKEVFENESLSRRYSAFLNGHVLNSNVYRYRGDVAETTSYQISQIWVAEKQFRMKERRFELLLLHPESRSAFEQRMELERDSDPQSMRFALPEHEKERQTTALVDQVYVTLFILWEAARKGEGTDIVVAFYKDVPFYRCEIVQAGLSITYYTKGTYSGTFFHGADSFVFTAFLRAFQVALRKSDQFSLMDMDRETLLKRLGGIGYKGDMLQLMRSAKERVERLRLQHNLLSSLNQ